MPAASALLNRQPESWIKSTTFNIDDKGNLVAQWLAFVPMVISEVWSLDTLTSHFVLTYRIIRTCLVTRHFEDHANSTCFLFPLMYTDGIEYGITQCRSTSLKQASSRCHWVSALIFLGGWRTQPCSQNTGTFPYGGLSISSDALRYHAVAAGVVCKCAINRWMTHKTREAAEHNMTELPHS